MSQLFTLISRFARCAAIALPALVLAAPASARTLFYNGSLNGSGSTGAYNTYLGDAMIYENFVVGGTGIDSCAESATVRMPPTGSAG